jgi:uncharacterized membrane protein
MQIANRPQLPDGVGTLLLSVKPFSAADLDRLHAVSGEMGFEVMLSPRTTADDLFPKLLDAATGVQVARTYPLRISAPTDDSPFFFNMLRFHDLLDWHLLNAGKQTQNVRAVLVLAILFTTLCGLTTACIGAPLWLGGGRADLARAPALLAYFACIGLGFMLIETSQMQRLIIVLGHPTYGLTVVLFTLLLASGTGSYLSGRLRPLNTDRAGGLVFGPLVATLVVFGLLTPVVAVTFEAATTPMRIAAAIIVLVPPAVLMGMAFPLGMRFASARVPTLTPWLWGVNGAASVLATVLAVVIALAWSISTAFWSGVVCYALAAWCLRSERRQSQR